MQDTIGRTPVTIHAENKTLEEIFEEIAQKTGVEFDLRWGTVVFSTPERLWPEPGMTMPLEACSGELAGLDRQMTLDVHDMTPIEILVQVAEEAGLKIDFKEPNLLKAGKIRMYWVKVSVRDILRLLTRPFGDDVREVDGGFEIAPSGR